MIDHFRNQRTKRLVAPPIEQQTPKHGLQAQSTGL